jgi:hypothetical protein
LGRILRDLRENELLDEELVELKEVIDDWTLEAVVVLRLLLL